MNTMTKYEQLTKFHLWVKFPFNAGVSKRKVVCGVQRKVETFMQLYREKFCVFTQVNGLGLFKTTLTRLFATHHSHSLPRQMKPTYLPTLEKLKLGPLRCDVI